jgi:pilus assembly protein CpaB
MNRTRLLMIGFLALAVGFLASVYVYKSMQGRGGDAGVEVMVAANNLQVGQRIEEHDIRIIHINPADLPPRTPRRRSEVIGHGVIVPISKGEFILPNRLAGENAGSGLPSLIPPGMRAVSVRVNEVVSVAGFVTPGTRVDVLLTGTPPSGGSEEQTTTVLQNVAVLASGHTLERTSTGEAQTTAVITLLVTPDDAERLALASSGHIQLALRNPLDTRQEEVAAFSSRGLYKMASTPSAPARAPIHHVQTAKATPPPPASTGVSVEVYQGDKKPDIIKCGDDGCEAAK